MKATHSFELIERVRVGGTPRRRAVIVVATKAHRDRLESSLAECGIDLTAVAATGQYIALDAAETLRPIHGRFIA